LLLPVHDTDYTPAHEEREAAVAYCDNPRLAIVRHGDEEERSRWPTLRLPARRRDLWSSRTF